MELADPAGAESLAPQPSQLASAVASTKKSLLANFAQPRWQSLGRQKDQKNAQDHARRRWLTGRMEGWATGRLWSRRASQPPLHTTDGHTLFVGGEGVHFIANAKHLYMHANLALILEKHNLPVYEKLIQPFSK
jgi:hypothetical protein